MRKIDEGPIMVAWDGRDFRVATINGTDFGSYKGYDVSKAVRLWEVLHGNLRELDESEIGTRTILESPYIPTDGNQRVELFEQIIKDARDVAIQRMKRIFSVSSTVRDISLPELNAEALERINVLEESNCFPFLGRKRKMGELTEYERLIPRESAYLKKDFDLISERELPKKYNPFGYDAELHASGIGKVQKGLKPPTSSLRLITVRPRVQFYGLE